MSYECRSQYTSWIFGYNFEMKIIFILYQIFHVQNNGFLVNIPCYSINISRLIHLGILYSTLNLSTTIALKASRLFFASFLLAIKEMKKISYEDFFSFFWLDPKETKSQGCEFTKQPALFTA